MALTEGKTMHAIKKQSSAGEIPQPPAPKNQHRVELAMTHTIALQPIQVPNFIIPVQQAGKRQDGYVQVPTIPVGDLSVETLEALCAEFRRGLFAKAGKEPA